MPKKFSELLKMSFTSWKAQFQSLAIAAVAIAVLLQLAQILSLSTVDQYSKDFLNKLPQERVEELTQRMQDGDESAMAEFMQEMGMIPDNEDGELDPQVAVRAVVQESLRSLLPALSFYVLIAFLIVTVAQSLYLILTIEKPIDPQVLLKRSVKVAPALVGVWIWVFVRSFAWIPIIGIIPAIVLGPRFVLAPVLLIQEKKGIMATAEKSYAATRGYWGKIVGNLLLMGLVVAIGMWAVGLLAGIITSFAPKIHLLVSLFIGQMATAFSVIFLVKLTDTILKFPMGVSKRK